MGFLRGEIKISHPEKFTLLVVLYVLNSVVIKTTADMQRQRIYMNNLTVFFKDSRKLKAIWTKDNETKRLQALIIME